MADIERRETIRHQTGDMPLAYYPVDEHFPRYRMQLHWHRETELIYVREGRIHLVPGGADIDARAGDLILIGSGTIHAGVPQGCRYDCIVFDPEALLPRIPSCKSAAARLAGRCVHFGGAAAIPAKGDVKNGNIVADSLFAADIRRLYALCEGGIPGRETELLGALFTLLGDILQRLPDAGARVRSDDLYRGEQLKPALEYIEQNYREHITLDALARISGFSPKYFCRYFRAIVHRSPIDYVNYYRIERAAEHLTETDMNVAEVAALCGFADSSAFIKQFRKYKGTTPKQYVLRARDGAGNNEQ